MTRQDWRPAYLEVASGSIPLKGIIVGPFVIDDDGESAADCISAAFAMIGISARPADSLDKCYIKYAL
jgi:hypothetical protein